MRGPVQSANDRPAFGDLKPSLGMANVSENALADIR